MGTKRSTDLFVMLIVTGALGLMVLGLFVIQTMKLSFNGVVCNHSSTDIWITVTEARRQRTNALAPGGCTNVTRQDVEAIWGKDCHTGSCTYQAWKVSAGRFDIEDGENALSGFTLRIKGWGAGSRWQITRDWPKPDLSSISYSLVR